MERKRLELSPDKMAGLDLETLSHKADQLNRQNRQTHTKKNVRGNAFDPLWELLGRHQAKLRCREGHTKGQSYFSYFLRLNLK